MSKLPFGMGCDSSTQAPGASPSVWQQGSPCLPVSSLPAPLGEGRGCPFAPSDCTGLSWGCWKWDFAKGA